MPIAKNIAGRRYGKLIALADSNTSAKHGRGRIWICHCDCGGVVNVPVGRLSNGHIKSCGCLTHGEEKSKQLTTHGMSKTGTYDTWAGMITRCRNTKHISYLNYGGRGIKVSKRWLKFENFFADMGERPVGKSLDRINTNGNYEPDNCRWASRKEQILNQRRVIFYAYAGKVLCMTDWQREIRKNGIRC